MKKITFLILNPKQAQAQSNPPDPSGDPFGNQNGDKCRIKHKANLKKTVRIISQFKVRLIHNELI